MEQSNLCPKTANINGSKIEGLYSSYIYEEIKTKTIFTLFEIETNYRKTSKIL